ncbi:MAG: DHA2 family efflux MFS transporter permease subunit, partial [Actinobacteria bacterium]|nr:DHA2 family efflux MFS transporter permease subunit [Actinomycetota bacterium]
IPTIVRDLGVTQSQIQWIIDSYTLVFAGLLLTAGSLGDRFGRRGALQIGLILFGLGSLGATFVATANGLIGIRAFMGIGGAAIMPATLSIITNVFPGHERGKAIGIWAGTAGIGGALGPLVGGMLLQHYSWQSVFYVNIPIVTIGLIAGVFLIPTSKDPSAPRLDPVGAVLSMTALFGLLWALIQAPTEGWTSRNTLGGLAIGSLLMLAFVMWELHSSHPMLDMKLFRNARFTAANTSITFVFFAMFGSMFLITQYLQFVIGYSPLQTGIRMVPFSLAMMVVAPNSTRIVHKFGTKITVATGMAVVTFGLILLSFLTAESSYFSIATRMMFLAAGMGLVMAPATESVMSSLPLAKAGVGSAVNDTTRQVGGALGVAVIGSVLASIYATKLGDFFQNATLANAFPGKIVPEQLKTFALGGIGTATNAAANLRADNPFPGSGVAADLLESASRAAYVDGMRVGMRVAAGVAVLGVLVAAKYLPARTSAADENRQADELAAEYERSGINKALAD